MKKKDLKDFIAKKIKITKSKANEVLNAVFEGIAEGIKKDGRASFSGFGHFSLHQRKARDGRNPKTGEPLKIKAGKIIRFKPGKNLKTLKSF